MDTDTTSIVGNSVASGGTNRIDDITISGTAAVPEPASVGLLGAGALALARRRRRA